MTSRMLLWARSRAVPLVAVAGVLCAAAPGASFATVRYVVAPVAALGPPASPYTTPQTAAATITDALAVSGPGDTVQVAGQAGSPLDYPERITLTSGVALLGGFDLAGTPFASRDPDSIVSAIRGGGAGSVVVVETGAVRSTILDGFLIRDGFAPAGGGLFSSGGSLTVRGNVFYLNQGATGGGAIRLVNGADALIVGNSFIRNTSPSQSGAVDITGSAPEVVNNIFYQDLLGAGIRCDAASSPSIRFNDFFRNVGGDTARGACDASPDSGNVSIDPLFCDVDGERFTIFAESRIRGIGEGGADMGATGVGCRARVKFVSPDGAAIYPYSDVVGAATRIQDALAISSAGDTVRVAEGTYRERVTVPAGVVLEGSWNTIFTARRVFGGVSVLDSDSTALGPLAMFQDDGGVSATLDGFVVTGGHATEGSAIQVSNASPVLRGLSVLLNVSSNPAGGAIHVDGGAPEIVNTLIAINRGAGISCANGASPDIHHSGFFENSGGELSGCPGPLPATVLTEDPLFCSAAACSVEGDSVSCVYANGNFHIYTESRYNDGADDGGLIGALTSECNFATHYVSLSGGNRFPYTTAADAANDIQTALDVAAPLDLVLVEGGVYSGVVQMAPGVEILGGWDAAFTERDPVANECTLLGDVPGVATVLAQGLDVDAGSILDGFTISHQPGVDGPGVEIKDSSSPKIVGNLVTGNTTAGDAAGILVENASPTIINNTVLQNTTTSTSPNRAGGILFRQAASGLSVTLNIFYDNSGGYGISCDGLVPPGSDVSQNIAFLNDGVPEIGDDPNIAEDWCGVLITSNIRQDPLFCDYAGGEITLCYTSPARQSECGETVIGARGIGCIHCGGAPHTFYVRAENSGTRFPYGGSACAAAHLSDVDPLLQAGDAVLVALGTYRETLTVKPNVTYTAGFNTEFTLRNSQSVINGEARRRCIMVPAGIDENTIIEGFSCSNGKARVDTTEIDSTEVDTTLGWGGGLLVSGGSSPIIRELRFGAERSGNQADSGGAAIYCAPGSSPKIRFCYFTENRIPIPVSPIVTLDSSSAEVSNCTFFDNLTIGIDILSDSPSVFNNILMRNDRGGIRCGAGATPDLGQNNAFANDDFQYDGCSDSLLAFNISENPIFCNLEAQTLPLFDHSPSAGTGRGGGNMGAFPIGCHTTRHFVTAASPSPQYPFACPDSATSSIGAALALAGRNTIGSGSQDTVFIAGGVYNEDVTIPPNVVVLGGYPADFGRPLSCATTHFNPSMRFPELFPVIIRGTGSGPVMTIPAGGDFNTTFVEGIGIRGGQAARGGGIFIDRGASLQMRDVSVDSCVATIEGGGIYVSPSAFPHIEFFSALFNSAPAGAAIFGDSLSVAWFDKCTVLQNASPATSGVIEFRSFQGRLSYSIIAENVGLGIKADAGTVFGEEFDFRENLLWNNTPPDTSGIRIPPGGNIRFGDPRFCDAPAGDFTVFYKSPAVLKPCARPEIFPDRTSEVIGRFPVGCTDPGHRFLVAVGQQPSYPYACPLTAAGTVSEILPRIASQPGSTDSILVASGVFRDNMEMSKPVALLGGWPPNFAERNPAVNVTVIQPLNGTIGPILKIESAKDESGVVIPETRIDSTAVIDGITFTLGRASLDNGGAIACLDASPRISNNIFFKNTSDNSGGGIYASRTKSQPIRGNSFNQNRAGNGGGIYLVDCEQPIVTGNLIVANTADLRGAGIRLANHIGAASIDNNTIVNNKGEGISFANDNASSSAAGSKSQIYNNIIAFNTRAGLERYPVTTVDSLPVQDHNLHWGNRAGNFSATAPGAGDVFLDPLFCALATNDLRLQRCSPAIGAGRDAADSVIGHLPSADTLLTCRDQTAPSVTIAFLKNTIVPRFLDVYVTFSEVVVESTLSVLRICENQASIPLSPGRTDTSSSVYAMTGLETSNCGVLTIDVTATDACANGVHFNRQVSTVLVPPGGGAQLKSPDGVVRVEVPAGRGGREALLLLATAADSRDGLEDAADAEVIETLGQPLGPSYEVLGANDLGIGGVALRFRLPTEVTPEDAGAVALYRKIDTGWVRVESWVDDADRSVVGSIEGDGVFRLILTGDRSVSPSLPKQVALYPSRPNPAPGRATILFDLPARSEATLRVYDATGRRVATLVDRELPPGRHAFEWRGTDGSGRRVPSGVYFYELRAGQTTETRKLVLIR